MFEHMLGPGLGAGLIDAILAQPEHLQLWAAWLVFINLAVPLLLWPRTEAWVTQIAFLVSAAIMSYLFETFGYSQILGLAHLAVWPPLLLWLWSRWYGIDCVWTRLWVSVLAISNVSSLILDARDAALFLIH